MSKTFDFGDGQGPVPAHQHENGGGWVADSATVEKSAVVEISARVYGAAQVYDNAQVCGAARVCGDARVYGDADFITISPIGREGGCLTVFRQKDKSVLCTRGCFSGDVEALAVAVEQTHGDSSHGRIYRAAIALIRAKFDL